MGSIAEAHYREEDFFLFEASRLPAGQVKPGRPEGRWGAAALDYIRQGASGRWRNQVQALVTSPVSKEVIRQTDPGFTGHTEFLAALAGTKRFGMMLAGKRLKVSLVTIHCSMRETLRRMKTEAILETIELTQETLTRVSASRNRASPWPALIPMPARAGLSGARRRRSSPRRSGRPGPGPPGFRAPPSGHAFLLGGPGAL